VPQFVVVNAAGDPIKAGISCAVLRYTEPEVRVWVWTGGYSVEPRLIHPESWDPQRGKVSLVPFASAEKSDELTRSFVLVWESPRVWDTRPDYFTLHLESRDTGQVQICDVQVGDGGSGFTAPFTSLEQGEPGLPKSPFAQEKGSSNLALATESFDNVKGKVKERFDNVKGNVKELAVQAKTGATRIFMVVMLAAGVACSCCIVVCCFCCWEVRNKIHGRALEPQERGNSCRARAAGAAHNIADWLGPKLAGHAQQASAASTQPQPVWGGFQHPFGGAVLPAQNQN
jgi:hypothetical protein